MIVKAEPVEQLIENTKDTELRLIGEKVFEEKRLTSDEGVILFEKGNLGL